LNARDHLRARILELVPSDRFVAAADVVATLSSELPATALWSEIVLLAFDGLIESDKPGTYNGQAMVRRNA
jgi:hypothetical protein